VFQSGLFRIQHLLVQLQRLPKVHYLRIEDRCIYLLMAVVEGYAGTALIRHRISFLSASCLCDIQMIWPMCNPCDVYPLWKNFPYVFSVRNGAELMRGELNFSEKSVCGPAMSFPGPNGTSVYPTCVFSTQDTEDQ
jgi:hypothetical protein